MRKIFAAVVLSAMLLCSCSSADSSESSASGDESDDSFEVVKIMVEYTYYCNTLDELLQHSDAVVIGEFSSEPEYYFEEADTPCLSCDLRIDRVLEGDLEEGSTVKYKQNSAFTEYPKRGKVLLSDSELAPPNKGEKWIFFLSYQKDFDCYWATGDGSGRLPLPEDRGKPDANGFVDGRIEQNLNYQICADTYERYRLK